MKTIYAVSEGEYSDYGVICLCESRADAEKTIELLGHGFIEEVTLFDRVPRVVEHHELAVTYDREGNRCDDEYHYVSKEVESPDDNVLMPRADIRGCVGPSTEKGRSFSLLEGRRQLRVWAMSRETCDAIHEYYRTRIFEKEFEPNGWQMELKIAPESYSPDSTPTA